MTNQTETTEPKAHTEAGGQVERVVMPTLRQDLMDAIGRYRDENRENALAQTRATQEGASMALRYAIQADTADRFAMLAHSILQKHGF
jgi:hypothetical protein